MALDLFSMISRAVWEDSFFYNLTQHEKLAFIYLLTNSRTRLCGVYELNLRKMASEMQVPLEEIKQTFMHFESAGKIVWNGETSEIAIINWFKYNGSSSATVKIRIEQERRSVKAKHLLTLLNYERFPDLTYNP